MLPFSFTGRIRRLPYALWSFGVFLSQHLVVAAIFQRENLSLNVDWWFLFVPFRSFVTHAQMSAGALSLAFLYLLIVACALAALAFRRAADADINEWIAAAAMAPFLQVAVMVFLCAVPSRHAEPASPLADGARAVASGWMAVLLSVIACIGVMLSAVAMGTLLFSVYGFGIFVMSPFIIGAITAYVANLHADIGAARTAQLLAAATAIGAIGLVAAALEGIVCVVLVAPLAFGMALVGGMLGRSIALSSKRPARAALSGFALLPVVFALENVVPAATSFDTHQTIEVEAPPDVVWTSILRMDRIDEPLGLAFRLGVAYPVSGEVLGEGIGAERRGEFSTGVAIERVTEWVPNRKLAFVIVNDVPAMRELSPYEHVHAPHVMGYFSTKYTSFELVERPSGGTRIIERTSHELKLEPVLYWLPLARWIVGENNARVLAHVKRQAERKSAS